MARRKKCRRYNLYDFVSDSKRERALATLVRWRYGTRVVCVLAVTGVLQDIMVLLMRLLS